MYKHVKVRIKKIQWCDLSRATQYRYLDLTLPGSGTMRHFILATKPTLFVAYASNLSGTLNGQRAGLAVWDHNTNWLMFYVKGKYRQAGVATALMDETLRHAVRPKVSEWTTASSRFFKPYLETNKVVDGNYSEIEPFHQRYFKWSKT